MTNVSINSAEGLKELLQSATQLRHTPEKALCGTLPASETGDAKTLLSSLLPHGNSNKRPIDQMPTLCLESTQEMYFDAVTCLTTDISQVKHASQISKYGKLVAVTAHAIAYVLHDKRIRLLGQANGAKGIMEIHDDTRLPIVDISWFGENLHEGGVERGSLNLPKSHLLASLSDGGELCIGNVYSDSSTSLAYNLISAFTLPECVPAAGLTWGGRSTSPRIALFGTAQGCVYILDLNLPSSSAKKFYISTNLISIESLLFDEPDATLLYVAGLNRVDVFSLEDLDDIKCTQSIMLPSTVKRVWLLRHSQGIAAAMILPSNQLMIQPLFGNMDSILISISLPEDIQDSFCLLDRASDILCVGSLASNRIVFVNLKVPSQPIVAAGTWPNDGGSVSVFISSQLHDVFGTSPSIGSNLYFYAYHVGAVKYHRFTINWGRTVSVNTPCAVPSPLPKNQSNLVRTGNSAGDSRGKLKGEENNTLSSPFNSQFLSNKIPASSSITPSASMASLSNHSNRPLVKTLGGASATSRARGALQQLETEHVIIDSGSHLRDILTKEATDGKTVLIFSLMNDNPLLF